MCANVCGFMGAESPEPRNSQTSEGSLLMITVCMTTNEDLQRSKELGITAEYLRDLGPEIQICLFMRGPTSETTQKGMYQRH